MERLDIKFAESHNSVAENIKSLEELFPQAFTEGKIDFEILKQLLGEYTDTNEIGRAHV